MKTYEVKLKIKGVLDAESKYEAVKKAYELLSDPSDKVLEYYSYETKEAEVTSQYWVNFILKRTDRHTKETKVWYSPSTSPFNTLDKTHNEIQSMRQRDDFDVVSAWIDKSDGDNTTTVFHDCYINFVGNIEK